MSMGNQQPWPGATDEREASARHRGLLSKDDYTLLHQLGTATAWAGLAYAANWSDFSGTEAAGRYRKAATGRIELVGLVKKGVALVANDTIATLPAGFRPAKTKRFAAVSSAGYTEIDIYATGVVQVGAGGGNAYISLDGIAFDPAT